MSPFFKKDRLKQPELRDPVPAEALVLRGDAGYSAMSWWSASIRLQVAVPGLAPTIVEHACNAVREKTPLVGSVLPIEAERDDPTQVRIRWEAVPTTDERIANRDPLIFDPESAWRVVLAADPTQAERKPSWGNGTLPGWPSNEGLRHGQSAGTALVIAHSGDPGGNIDTGFSVPSVGRYSYGGTIETGLHTYLGWLLLCVKPYDGEPYGLGLDIKVRRDRFGPVLPVAIRPDKPADIEIQWDVAPDAPPPPSDEAQLANAVVHGAQVKVIEPGSAPPTDVFARVENPKARALGDKLLGRLAAKGATIVVSSSAQEGAPADRSGALAQLQELRDKGVISPDDFDAAVAKLPPS